MLIFFYRSFFLVFALFFCTLSVYSEIKIIPDAIRRVVVAKGKSTSVKYSIKNVSVSTQSINFLIRNHYDNKYYALDANKWLSLSLERLYLAPEQTKDIILNFSPPKEASGTYAAMLYMQARGLKKKGANKFFSLDRSFAIYMMIDGTQLRDFIISDLTVLSNFITHDMSFEFIFHNTGNVFIKAVGDMLIHKWGDEQWVRVDAIGFGLSSVSMDQRKVVRANYSDFLVKNTKGRYKVSLYMRVVYKDGSNKEESFSQSISLNIDKHGNSSFHPNTYKYIIKKNGKKSLKKIKQKLENTVLRRTYKGKMLLGASK